jgi:hypothetical protein
VPQAPPWQGDGPVEKGGFVRFDDEAMDYERAIADPPRRWRDASKVPSIRCTTG